MKIRIDESFYDLDSIKAIDAGGEGEIYKLDAASLAKIYHDDVLNRYRQEKVLALCDKYSYFRGLLGEGNYAFPRKSALDGCTGDLVGFEMADVGRLPKLNQIFFDNQIGNYRTVDGQQLDDSKSVRLVYDLFDRLERLHMARIIVGDLNPSNILFDFKTGNPVFIDLDSVALGQFESYTTGKRKARNTPRYPRADSGQSFDCEVFSEDYLDPEVEKRGRTVSGALKYSSEGDIFSMAVIAFELFVGTNPYWHKCINSKGVQENKRQKASLLGQHADPSYLSKLGITYQSSIVHEKILSRIESLKQADRTLYLYLIDILTKEGERESLLRRLKVTDPRHPAYSFFNKSICETIEKGWEQAKKSLGKPKPHVTILTDEDIEVIEGYIQARTTFKMKQEAIRSNDPPTFKTLVENMGINYGKLITEGVK